jgi:hypothetical protein
MSVRPEDEQLLRSAYAAFNRKDVEAVLATMVSDVDWPNMLEGTRAVGHDAVRAYWLDQFARLDPSVEPIACGLDAAGDIVVRVRQVIRTLEGEVLSDQEVQHVYTMRDGLVAAMDVRDAHGVLTSAPRVS